jgi:uncharacterized protein
MDNASILLGAATVPPSLLLKYANRHGLIAGATGTGKTVSLQILIEGLSVRGVPVFAADIKGDLSGISQPGEAKPKLIERAQLVGMSQYVFRACPTVFWDLFGEQGHPVRTTVSEMGPLLLSRLLELNDTQEGVLNIVFRVADEQGLLLLDLKDLRAMLNYIAENASELTTAYGNVSKASVGAIQRQLLVLENQGAGHFFGEPALDLNDFIRCDATGQGIVNILAANKLMQHPRLYACFLLWILSELFENLPEVGDPEKPRLVFFFDEAHLLFTDAPKALLEKVAQVVRLVRSKGVGVFFISQNPLDIPDTVLSQLGNRVQHALRAFTPRDQKAVRAAAETFRPNPELDVAQVIGELAVGEALVSMLEDKGTPGIVQRTMMCPPSARLGPVTAEERAGTLAVSPMKGRYDMGVDRVSAHEQLIQRSQQAAAEADKGAKQAEPTGSSSEAGWWQKQNRESTAGGRAASGAGARRSNRQGIGEAMAKSVARSVGSSIGREVGRKILRGVLGSILK